MTLFRSGATVGAFTTPEGMAVADIDGDRHLDLLVSNFFRGTISVLLGNGDGTFTAASPIRTAGDAYWVGAGDLDRDGDIDLISTSGAGGSNEGGVFVSLNDGGGGFTTSGWLHRTLEPAGLQLGDLDGDGDLDYAYVDYPRQTPASTPSITIMLNGATTPFTPPLTFTPAPGSPIDLSDASLNLLMADLDNDDDLDLAVAITELGVVEIFLNNSHGVFTAGPTVTLGNGPLGMAAGDVNGDGVEDLLVTDLTGDAVTVLLNTGVDAGGPRYTSSRVAVGDAPFDVELGDLDGDGDLDAVTIARNDGDVYVLLNDGHGTFTPSPDGPFQVGSQPKDITLADFDEDGDLDIATSNEASNDVSILLNTGSNYSVTSAVSAGEGFPGAARELVFTITRTATSEAEDIPYTLGGTASGTDYTAPLNMTVSFAANQKTAEVRIAVTGDWEVENDETVVLTLGTPSGEGKVSTAAGSGTATILNDDFPPPPNTAPVINSANADVAVQSGVAISLIIGDGHFTDADGNDLDYTITVDGGTIPAWLSFDAETGTLTGTPTTAEAGSHVISVTASDGSLSSASDAFNLTVSNPIAPQNPKGTKGDDKLVGDDGDNILDGRKGDDKLTGGEGADTFVFGKKYGHDVIKDFDPTEGDRIDLSDAAGIKGFDDLMKHHVKDTGDHIKITADDGSVLVIRNFEPDALTEDMFVF